MHGKYFMENKLYQVIYSPAIKEYSAYGINKFDWLTLLHHLNSHEIEGAHHEVYNRPRGTTSDNFDKYELKDFLIKSLSDYMNENIITPELANKINYNSPEILVPPEELELFNAARELLNKFRRRDWNIKMKTNDRPFGF
jgi:hypothetical protein